MLVSAGLAALGSGSTALVNQQTKSRLTPKRRGAARALVRRAQ